MNLRCKASYNFSLGILYFILKFAHLWWFGVLDWVFGVGDFSWAGGCGVGLSGFFGVGALYITIKELCLEQRLEINPNSNILSKTVSTSILELYILV